MFIPGSRQLLIWLALIAAAPAAHAQFAVIDVGAITQLIVQVRTLADQLQTAREHLAQTQSEFRSMIGGRGMELLLAGTKRNYLPPDWAQLQDVLKNASGAYSALSMSLRETIRANAVLSGEQLAALAPAERQEIATARETAAMLQVLARQALATTSDRFAAIQQLIDAIPAAADQKAILDLQARIGAEQGMLQNEQTKLQVLYQTTQGQAWAAQQSTHEQVVAGHGQFSSRFQASL